MSALDEVLETYRDMFGVKTDRANNTHRLACEEVARLREAAEHSVQRTAFAAFCGGVIFGMFIMLVFGALL